MGEYQNLLEQCLTAIDEGVQDATKMANIVVDGVYENVNQNLQNCLVLWKKAVSEESDGKIVALSDYFYIKNKTIELNKEKAGELVSKVPKQDRNLFFSKDNGDKDMLAVYKSYFKIVKEQYTIPLSNAIKESIGDLKKDKIDIFIIETSIQLVLLLIKATKFIDRQYIKAEDQWESNMLPPVVNSDDILKSARTFFTRLVA